MTHLRLFWIHLRLGVLNELQYRTNLVIQLVQSTLGLATALLGLGIVFSKTDTLAGWRPAELLAIVGVFTLVRGLRSWSCGRVWRDSWRTCGWARSISS